MAFRIQLRGAVIEADTAHDVQALLVLMATALPRQLPSGPAVVDVEEGRPSARRRRPRRAAARRAAKCKTRLGGGVAKPVPRPRIPRAAATSSGPLLERVLEAINAGVEKPAAICKRVKGDRNQVSQSLKDLLRAGRVRVEGATVSRRYLPAGRHPVATAPKEGV